MKANGDSIYGAGSTPFSEGHLGHVTGKGNKIYVHLTCWPGKEMCVVGIRNPVIRAYMLATGEDLTFEQRKDRLFVCGLPSRSPDPIDTVVALELDGKPRSMPASFWK